MTGRKGEEKGIKSALELALERFGGAGEGERLTAGQKERLEDIERERRAKVAEVEILSGQGIAEAAAAGDTEKVRVLQEQKAAEIARLGRAAEKKKKKVRGEGGAPQR